MQRSAFLTIAALVLASMALSDPAEAKRLGGGKSFGAQRQSVAPGSATPPAAAPSGAASQPVMPAQPGATLPAKPVAPAAPAPSGASRWLGPIAGIAAGLGLAALLSHFGLPEGLGTFLLLALLAVGAVFVVRMLIARRASGQRPLAYAGATSPAGASGSFGSPSTAQWGATPKLEPVLGSALPAGSKALPPDFDAAAFIRHAKQQFIRLQAAHDAGDRKALADVLTPEMYAEIGRDLDSSVGRGSTEVITLNAEVLEVQTEGDRHWASVRFSGTLSEGGAVAAGFDEVWNLTKPVDGSSGWLLAGIQQMA